MTVNIALFVTFICKGVNPVSNNNQPIRKIEKKGWGTRSERKLSKNKTRRQAENEFFPIEVVDLDRYFWYSTEKMTILVTVNNKIVTDAPPIAKKFINQPQSNLERWLNKQGGLVKQELWEDGAESIRQFELEIEGEG